ncbi:restriction endonuclease subunit S [Arthrobacter sp. CG_A4]|uniref:restriction endonuclease subunit S n=1 Tax=Arthrobacter sp. CG_A4 TaxID=3071706 RepID=UPI003FA345A5
MSGRQRSPHLTSGPPTPYLRVANVLDGRINYTDVNSMPFTSSEVEKYRLVPGDILLNEGQSVNLVGRAAMFEDPENTYCFQNTLIRYRAGDSVDPDFALQLFRFSQREGIFSKIAVRTNSIAHLGVSRFSELELRFPPLPEQRKIAEILRTWDDAIERVDSKRRQSLQRRTGLVQTLIFRHGWPHGVIWHQTAPGWDIRPIGKVASDVSSRNADLKATDVLTCSKHRGFVRSADYFARTVHSADLSNYKIIRRGQFGFPSNHIDRSAKRCGCGCGKPDLHSVRVRPVTSRCRFCLPSSKDARLRPHV